MNQLVSWPAAVTPLQRPFARRLSSFSTAPAIIALVGVTLAWGGAAQPALRDGPVAPLPPRVAGEVPGPMPRTHRPETTAGWAKHEGNPVMGGQYGMCFDISVLREGGTYRMWLSWRPKQSVALVESKDGFHWSEPP